MKALTYIVIPMLLISGSCASTLYTGAEYDDLYYSPSDQPVKERTTVNDQVAAKELQPNNYYDNVYAGDTLVAENYASPSDYDDQIIVNNNMGGSGYDYYDDSYANRLNMFYGNYFNPYWNDPYYFNFGYSYGSPYFGFGYNYGYPYFGLGFSFSWGYPYYGYGYPYYGYGYPYYGYGYPYYGYGCCYPYYGYSEGYYPSYGRRERPSNLSSHYNDNMGTAGGRRSSDGTGGTYSGTGRRAYPGGAATSTAVADSRRSSTNSGTGSRVSQEGVRNEGGTTRSASTTTRSQADQRPEYKNANRSYTPSYNNPRMSTRPSYNNSRVSEGSGSNQGQTRNFNNSYPSRSSQGRVINQNSGSKERSSFGNMQRRYSTPSSSSRQYSAPAPRRSSEGSRSYSPGSSSSRSSYSGGSSSGGSRSSSSGGSSFSGGGGGRSSSSSHSSGSRR